MRGDDNQQEGMFSYVSPEKRVPADHPLRAIRKMVDEILKETSPQFAKLYSDVGRPSIAPERLFRSLLLQIFYSVRSERMLIATCAKWQSSVDTKLRTNTPTLFPVPKRNDLASTSC
jgi:transposase